ncbi:MAG: hypothetical protein ACHQD9_01860 [Chitinophagales bacterium]
MASDFSLELLSKLSPAQTVYVLRPNSLLRDLLKYTLMDLILQERLQLVNYDPNPVQGMPRLGYAFVVTGKKFMDEKPQLHEMVFLFPFYRKKNSRPVMRHLMQMALNAARSESNFKQRLLMDLPEMKLLFAKRWWQKIFGGQKLTDEGKKSQAELIRQLNFLDKELPALLKTDREKASVILQNIKGNVLLMNSFKFDLIQRIGEELFLLEEELEEGKQSA